ncbi:unnamed protein product [Amoebophrya sp. A120]|nr:unnamed protein product [Amoebophrya sp. A120]|eukprot:GSA120T00025085001.1
MEHQERLALVKKSPRLTPRPDRVLLPLSPRHIKKATCTTMKKVMIISAVLLCGQELLVAPLCCVAFTLNKLRPTAASSSTSPEAEKLLHQKKCFQYADAKRLECHANAYGSFDKLVDAKVSESERNASVNAKVDEIRAAVQLVLRIGEINEQEQQAGAGAGAAPVAGPGRGADAPPALGEVQRAEEVQQKPGAVSQAMRAAVGVGHETGQPVVSYPALWHNLGGALVEGQEARAGDRVRTEKALREAVQLVKAARRCVLPRKRFVEENCATYVKNPTDGHHYADTAFVGTWDALEDAHAVIHSMEQLYIRVAVLSARIKHLRNAVAADVRRREERKRKEEKAEAEERAQEREDEEARKRELEQAAFAEEQQAIKEARKKVVNKLTKQERREAQETADWDAVIREIEQEREEARERERNEWARRLGEIRAKALRGERICLGDLEVEPSTAEQAAREKRKAHERRCALMQQSKEATRIRRNYKARDIETIRASAGYQRLMREKGELVLSESSGPNLERALSKDEVQRWVVTAVVNATKDATKWWNSCALPLLLHPTVGIQTLLRHAKHGVRHRLWEYIQNTAFGRQIVKSEQDDQNSIGGRKLFRKMCEAAAWQSAVLRIDLVLTQFKAMVHLGKKKLATSKKSRVAEVVPYGFVREWEVEAAMEASPCPSANKDQATLAKAKEVGETLRKKARLHLSEEERKVLVTEKVFEASPIIERNESLRTKFAAVKKVVEWAEEVERKMETKYSAALGQVEKGPGRHAVKLEADERAVLLAAARYEMMQIKDRARIQEPNTSMEDLFGKVIEGFREVSQLQAQSGSAFAALLSQWTASAADGGPPQLPTTDEQLSLKMKVFVYIQDLYTLPPFVSVLKTFNEAVWVTEGDKVSAYRFSSFGPGEIQYPFLATLSLLRDSQIAIGELMLKSEEELPRGEQPALDTLFDRLTEYNAATAPRRGRLEVLQTLTLEVMDDALLPALLQTTLLPVPKLVEEQPTPSCGVAQAGCSSSRSATPAAGLRGRNIKAKNPPSGAASNRPGRRSESKSGSSSSRGSSSGSRRASSRSPSRPRKCCGFRCSRGKPHRLAWCPLRCGTNPNQDLIDRLADLHCISISSTMELGIRRPFIVLIYLPTCIMLYT